MSELETELKKRAALRLSNKESRELTRDCIRTAMLHLLNTTSFDKITVTDIIRRSGVSRAGFYRNYSSKADVMDDTSELIIGHLTEPFVGDKFKNKPLQRYLTLFKTVKENPDTCRLLLKADVPREYIFRMEEAVKRLIPTSATRREYYYYIALAAALMDILVEWFQNGMKESPREMAKLMVSMFPEAT